jgi:hypothetical protein
MAGNVARLPSNSRGGDDGIAPADLYRIAVEEYRFQAQYNWSRTQYLLAFNAAILVVAVGLGSQAVPLDGLAFVLGFAASVLTVLVVRVQHGYYRAARDHMRRIEEDLSLDQRQRLDTTSTLGGRRSRVASVNQVVYLLLGILAAANLYGFLARLIASN